MLEGLPLQVDPNVLIGHAGSDDAGVYQISDDSALVLTVDFFTPIVDDPFDYGRVAATNALSDVYAMGARPIVALNIAGFPEKVLPPDVFTDILRGGSDVATRAGVAIVGGHTVDDKELKYGLAVVGTIHPDRIIANRGACPGDKLILTKPIGTGVLSTVHKEDKLDAAGVTQLVDVMTRLNKEASEQMVAVGVSACTDITGYGLIGHAYEMASSSDVTIHIDSAAVPLIDGALDAAGGGFLTGGGHKNRKYIDPYMRLDGGIDPNLQHLLFDPQTAGGLLIAVGADRADDLLNRLQRNYPKAAVVGTCADASDVSIVIN